MAILHQVLGHATQHHPGVFFWLLHRGAPRIWRLPGTRMWLVVRIEDVQQALARPEDFKAARFGDYAELCQGYPTFEGSGDHVGRVAEAFVIALDGEAHQAARSRMVEHFTRRRVAALGTMIDDMARSWVDALEADTPIEVVQSLAHPFPLRVVGHLIGLSDLPEDTLRSWSERIALMFDPARSWERRRSGAEALSAFSTHLHRVLAVRRRQPRDDLLSTLAQDPDELRAVADVAFLVLAGHETTTHWISTTLRRLAVHPEWFARVAQDDVMLQGLMWEALRLEPPVQVTIRVAQRDAELAGRQIRASDQVALAIGPAGRDPARFSHPARFDPTRQDRFRLAFGHGPHFCLGAWLAQTEMNAVLRHLLRRFARWEIAGRDALKETMYLRGRRALDLRFIPRRAQATSSVG